MCVIYDIKDRKFSTPTQTLNRKKRNLPLVDSKRFWEENINDIVELETNFTSSEEFENKFKKR